MAYSASFLIHLHVSDASTSQYGLLTAAVQPGWLCRMMATVELCQCMAARGGSSRGSCSIRKRTETGDLEHDHAERNVRRPADALFARCV